MIVNSLAPAANAFLAIFFNLPTAIFNFISLVLVFWLVLSLLKLFLGAK